ncbi:DUF2179 domain-containing protein [Xylanibacillus composti]|uniref:DUF2179 domain-containing protein n=1 Tax=Xylanibacillus composti TaxID=1572762 RepID=A0A8J4GYF1_9BACL|nr:hypothetical protein XYCOK13_03260 [Xylanibacillus composti]
MTVLVKRSNERRLTKKIQEHSPKAFIISYKPRYFRGGLLDKTHFTLIPVTPTLRLHLKRAGQIGRIHAPRSPLLKDVRLLHLQ